MFTNLTTEIQKLETNLELLKAKLQLLEAVGNDNLASVKICLKARNADILNCVEKNDNDMGRSPLMVAAEKGELEIARSLVR